MVNSKHAPKIFIALMAVAVALCLVAISFAETLTQKSTVKKMALITHILIDATDWKNIVGQFICLINDDDGSDSFFQRKPFPSNVSGTGG